jgi:hypothetical protein
MIRISFKNNEIQRPKVLKIAFEPGLFRV